MYAAVFYSGDPAQRHRTMEVYPRHKAYLDRFQDEVGGILLIGPFADQGGSMAVFRTREIAERFVADDPFVVEGLVSEARVVDWNALDFTGADAPA